MAKSASQDKGGPPDSKPIKRPRWEGDDPQTAAANIGRGYALRETRDRMDAQLDERKLKDRLKWSNENDILDKP